ncbi:MAG: hypothetical protein ABSH20_02005, partial [Tepidisphaeraceae bacterium]
MRFNRHLALSALLLLLSLSGFAQRGLTREQIIAETMKPYAGPSNPGVDPSTLTGKVMAGYQGWHAAEGDGLGRGW